MFLDKLFKAIGSIFTALFNSAKKTWKKLSPEVQNAMLYGTTIVAVINKNVDATPDFIIELIQKKFPDLTKEKIHEGLLKVVDALNLSMEVNDPDLETIIIRIKNYLGNLEGKVWAAISHTIASIFAIAAAPPETKFAVIASMLEYVYQHLIKNDE